MKKIMISVFAIASLAACSTNYDYYQGNVKYTQDGPDCIYYTGEQGTNMMGNADSINTGRRIVYKNTICGNLYNMDMAGMPARADRRIMAPAAAAPVCNSCSVMNGHREYISSPVYSAYKYSTPVLTRKYIVESTGY